MKKRMKKAFSILMAAAMVVGMLPAGALAEEPSAPGDRAGSAAKFRLGILSDVHYFSMDDLYAQGGETDFLMAGDLEARLMAETNGILMSALEGVLANEPDAVLVCGDLTSNGESANASAFAGILESVEAGNGPDVYVTNGNHDINNSFAADFTGESLKNAARILPHGGGGAEDFGNIYRDFGFDEGSTFYKTADQAAEDPSGSLSYVRRIDDGVDGKGGITLIAIDDNIYTLDTSERYEHAQETGGRVNEDLLDWIAEQAEAARANDDLVIAMCHHAIVPHYDRVVDGKGVVPGYDTSEDTTLMNLYHDSVIVENWETVATALADAGVTAVFTGHSHSSDISRYTTEKGNTLYDIESASLAAYPNSYREVVLTRTDTASGPVWDFDIETSLVEEYSGPARVPESGTDEYKLGNVSSISETGFSTLQDYSAKWTGLTADKMGLMAAWFIRGSAYEIVYSEKISGNPGKGAEKWIHDMAELPEDQTVYEALREAIAASAGTTGEFEFDFFGTTHMQYDISVDDEGNMIIDLTDLSEDQNNGDLTITLDVDKLCTQIEAGLEDMTRRVCEQTANNYVDNPAMAEVNKIAAYALQAVMTEEIGNSGMTALEIMNDAYLANARGDEAKATAEQKSRRESWRALLNDSFQTVVQEALGDLFIGLTYAETYPNLYGIMGHLYEEGSDGIKGLSAVSVEAENPDGFISTLADAVQTSEDPGTVLALFGVIARYMPMDLLQPVGGLLAGMERVMTEDHNIPEDSDWNFRTIRLDPCGGSVVSGLAATVEEEAIAGLPTPERGVEGQYEFEGWYTEEEGGTRVEAGDTTTAAVLYAHWKNLFYTVTFDVNGGEPLDEEIVQVTGGESVTLPTPVRQGYAFDGWYENDVKVTNLDNVAVNHELTARWSKLYDLVFYKDLGGTTELERIPLTAGASLSEYKDYKKSEMVLEDHTFAGWTLMANRKDSYNYKDTIPTEDSYLLYDFTDSTMPEGGLELAPVFIHDRLEVHLNLRAVDVEAAAEQYEWYTGKDYDGTTFDPNTPASMPELSPGETQKRQFNVDLGEKLRMSAMLAATRPGYTLTGWYSTGVVPWTADENGLSIWGVTPEYCDRVDGQPVKKTREGMNYDYYTVTLSAGWQAKEIPVLYTVGEHGTGTAPADGTASLGSSFTLPAAPDAAEHYYFSGWKDKKGDLHSAGAQFIFEDWTLTTKDGDEDVLAFTAEYTEKGHHLVIFDSDGGSSVASVQADEGATVEDFPVPTRKGYDFDGWYLGENKVTSVTMEGSDITLKAHWTPKDVTISFNTVGGTAVASITKPYLTELAAFKPDDPTKDYYDFAGWAPAFPDVMPAEDLVLTAQWTPKEYTLTFDADGGKFADGSTTKTVTGIYNADVTAPADPTRENAVFTGWNKDVPVHMPGEDLTIKATWHVHTPGEAVHENVTPATCTEDGSYDEVVYCTGCGIQLSRETKTETKLNHDWSTPSYTWSADNSKVTAERTCSRDASHKETETVNTSADRTEPTTETEGSVTYMAKFENEAFAKQTKTEVIPKIPVYTVTFDANGGTFPDQETKKVTEGPAGTEVAAPEEPSREGYFFKGWDNTIPSQIPAYSMTIRALWACDHQEGEPVKTNEKPATCEEDGSYNEVTYCTRCRLPLKTETKTIPALQHDWGEAEYEWSSDNSSVTAVRVCSRDTSHEQKETAQTTSVRVEPTKTEEGSVTYTAEFDNEAFETQTKTEVIPKLPDGGGSGGGGGSVDPTPVDPTPVDPGDEECQKDENCPIYPFQDSGPKAWYHDGVHYVLEEGIMNGTGETTFAPNDATTRAMIVTMLWRMEDEPEAAASGFTDLEAGSWYEKAVNWAAENKIVNGYSETKFGPNDKITREQLAAILYRYQMEDRRWKMEDDSSPISNLQSLISTYTDADQISDWAKDAFVWAVGTGIINGRTETTLVPKGEATRAEVATMIMRFETGE